MLKCLENKERDLLHRILGNDGDKMGQRSAVDEKADRLDQPSTCTGICFSTQKTAAREGFSHPTLQGQGKHH